MRVRASRTSLPRAYLSAPPPFGFVYQNTGTMLLLSRFISFFCQLTLCLLLIRRPGLDLLSHPHFSSLAAMTPCTSTANPSDLSRNKLIIDVNLPISLVTPAEVPNFQPFCSCCPRPYIVCPITGVVLEVIGCATITVTNYITTFEHTVGVVASEHLLHCAGVIGLDLAPFFGAYIVENIAFLP